MEVGVVSEECSVRFSMGTAYACSDAEVADKMPQQGFSAVPLKNGGFCLRQTGCAMASTRYALMCQPGIA